MQIAVPSTYILSLWLAAHSYEYRTPGSARAFSLCWGGFHCLFTRQEKRVFSLPLPPLFSFFVNVLCLLYRYIITREDKLLLNYHSRLLFLLSLFIPESQKKSSFLPWRKINTREGWDLEGICAHTVPPPRGGVVAQSRFVTTRLHGRYCAWRCGFLSGARIFRYTWKYVEGRVRSRRVGRGVELSVETPILSPVQSLSWLCRFEEMLRLPSLLLFSHSRIVISSFRSFSGEEREKKKEGKKKEEKYALSPCTFTLSPPDPHALHLCNFVPPFYPVCVLIDRSSRF